MKFVGMFSLCLALVVPAMLFGDDKKEEKKDEKKDELAAKFVGNWEVTKADEESLVGANIKMTKDGKFTITLTSGGQEFKVEGTWKIEDGKLVTEANGNGDTDTVKKISADEIELENKDGKKTTMKKKKD